MALKIQRIRPVPRLNCVRVESRFIVIQQAVAGRLLRGDPIVCPPNLAGKAGDEVSAFFDDYTGNVSHKSKPCAKILNERFGGGHS